MTLMVEVDGEDPEEIISNPKLRTRSKLSSSFRLGRSQSSVLFSDSIPFQSGRLTAYERLSESMRLSDEPDSAMDRLKTRNKQKKSAVWGFISKVFSFCKSSGRVGGISGDREVARAEKRRRKLGSSWLPDTNRRWPVQGWAVAGAEEKEV